MNDKFDFELDATFAGVSSSFSSPPPPAAACRTPPAAPPPPAAPDASPDAPPSPALPSPCGWKETDNKTSSEQWCDERDH